MSAAEVMSAADSLQMDRDIDAIQVDDKGSTTARPKWRAGTLVKAAGDAQASQAKHDTKIQHRYYH
eukprot:14192383-Heterocapsa_arctica.AAC.1